MISVSEKMKAYLLKTGRTFKGKIEVGAVTVYDGIMSILTDKSVCADRLTLGAVNCSYAEIAVYGSQIDFAGKEIKIYISAEIDGKDEWIKLGEFVAEKPQTEDNLTTFTAYDCIKYKTGNIYFPSASLGETAAIDDVFADVCEQCAVKYQPIADKSVISPAALSGYKCNIVLGMIAGFLGGNIVCNNEGKIEVRKFTECDYTIGENMFSFPKIGEDIFTVERISCNTGTSVLTSGQVGGCGIDFENPLMTQAQLDSIFGSLQGLSFQSVSVENLVGNPCVQAGDIITMSYNGKAYKVPVMHVITDFDGGVMNTFEAFVRTAEEEKGDLESVSEVVKEVADTVTRDTSEFAQAINGALGLYTSKQTLSDGSVKTYYHNTENIAESTYIYTRTGGGIAFATGDNCWNGGNPNWQYGIDKEGNAILNYLQVNKLKADLIKAGRLESNDGNTYFDLDNSQVISKSNFERDGKKYRTTSSSTNGGYTLNTYEVDDNGNDTGVPLSFVGIASNGIGLLKTQDDPNKTEPPGEKPNLDDDKYSGIVGYFKYVADFLQWVLKKVYYQPDNRLGINIVDQVKDKSSYYAADGAEIDGKVTAKDAEITDETNREIFRKSINAVRSGGVKSGTHTEDGQHDMYLSWDGSNPIIGVDKKDDSNNAATRLLLSTDSKTYMPNFETLPTTAFAGEYSSYFSQNPVKVRDAGMKTEIRGIIKTKNAPSNGTALLTLPDKFKRPKSNVYAIAAASGGRMAKIGMSTAGVLTCETVFNMDGSAYTGDKFYIQLDMDWPNT